MKPDKIYFEPDSLNYDLGLQLKAQFSDVEWIPIASHNNIEELRANENSEFAKMKRHIIIGVRKSLKHVPNNKISDFLVPYTSSGCSAMCLYCYLVCNYNKCSYLRLFVNREQMMAKLLKTATGSNKDLIFEIGSNSDLVLENTLTKNLEWTIENFAKSQKGLITFPTKFDMVDPLLPLNHNGKVLFRMSVNPQEVISKIELGTSNLKKRIEALNKICEAGYKIGILIAPVVMIENWQEHYKKLLEQLADELTQKAKNQLSIEVIFMTYSYVHRAINNQAFPNAVELYDKSLMTGRGQGKYCYRDQLRHSGEAFLREQCDNYLKGIPIIYVV